MSKKKTGRAIVEVKPSPELIEALENFKVALEVFAKLDAKSCYTVGKIKFVPDEGDEE